MSELASITPSRRRFMQLGAIAAASPLLAQSSQAQSGAKPDSNFNGVQIGTITYSYRGMPGSAEDILGYVVESGISSIELMGGPVEQFAGLPAGGGRPRREMSDEERKAMQQQREKQLEWRLSAPMDKFKALKKLYNNAGVNIHIVKFGNIGDESMSDGEIDYYFKVAKALGARGITREMSEDVARRLGPFADKHKIMIGFHNHTQITPTSYDGDYLSYGDYLGINLDIGHYVAGTNQSPIPFMEKHHDKILSLHIKDRKVNNGPNMPLGQGDTPLALILHLMKREGWSFPADIELEYPVPENSNPVAEVKKCVEFCKNVLA